MHRPSVTFYRGKLRFHNPCNRCGQEASYGQRVQTLKYVREKLAGKTPNPNLLGIWWCGPNNTCKNEHKNDRSAAS